MGTPLEVVGRQAELAKLTLSSTAPNAQRWSSLSAHAGMGKTTLWTVAVNEARELGWTVLARPARAAPRPHCLSPAYPTCSAP